MALKNTFSKLQMCLSRTSSDYPKLDSLHREPYSNS